MPYTLNNSHIIFFLTIGYLRFKNHKIQFTIVVLQLITAVVKNLKKRKKKQKKIKIERMRNAGQNWCRNYIGFFYKINETL